MEKKLLFGLTLPTSQSIKELVEKEILKWVPDMQFVCRYRKDGVFQYVKQQEDVILILEENLQGGSPYTEEELLLLTDLGNCHIIFLLNQIHKGDDYAHFMYSCGIYDGLYMEEVTAQNVLKLIKSGRGCAEARSYYGIQTLRDAEIAGNIVNEKYLDAYMEYVEDGSDREDINLRYRFVSSRLGAKENQEFAGNIATETAKHLTGNEIYQYYKSRTKDKHKWHFIRKASDSDKESHQDIALLRYPRTENMMEIDPHIGKAKESSFNEKRLNQTEKEEDMLEVMERFRNYGTEYFEGTDQIRDSEMDLRIQMGNYLRTIDI